MNYGMKVEINHSLLGKLTFRNVTEIHYNFKSAISRPQIAFESDTHSTGRTYLVEHIIEFETSLEEEIAENFSEG